MAYSDQFDCPACGHRFYRATTETWKDHLARFLSLFTEMVTPSETARLIHAGRILGMWDNRTTGYRRLAQIEAEGYLAQPTRGWWNLTERGDIAGKQFRMAHPPEESIVIGVNDALSIPGPSTPGRPARIEQVRTPTEWQLWFLQEFAKVPRCTLIGFNAVARWAKREGWLGKGGTNAIKMLIADGWLVWDASLNYLTLSESAEKLLSRQLAPVDGTPGVDN